jgi:hypothetical protein
VGTGVAAGKAAGQTKEGSDDPGSQLNGERFKIGKVGPVGPWLAPVTPMPNYKRVYQQLASTARLGYTSQCTFIVLVEVAQLAN